jgi:hypothetical protein
VIDTKLVPLVQPILDSAWNKQHEPMIDLGISQPSFFDRVPKALAKKMGFFVFIAL